MDVLSDYETSHTKKNVGEVKKKETIIEKMKPF